MSDAVQLAENCLKIEQKIKDILVQLDALMVEAHKARSLYFDADTAERRLSPRQTLILEMIRDGKVNKEIADKLNISERTVKFHVSNLLAKFGVANRIELCAWRSHESIPASDSVSIRRAIRRDS